MHPMASVRRSPSLPPIPADAWPVLRFATIPAIRIWLAQYPVHQLWSGSESLEVPAAETFIRVWRKNDFLVLHAPMDERESAALRKMVSGEPFAAICETFADLLELDAARETTALLARWLEDGIIARIGRAA
jgi:hypothetical protein